MTRRLNAVVPAPQHCRGLARGFALVPAVFLILVVGALMVVAVRMTTAQQQTVSGALQQARALAAARAGIDWMAYNALNGVNGGCTNNSLNLSAASLAGYTVVVTCTSTAYTDGNTASQSFLIAATATYGTYGTADYAKRVVRATFTTET